MIVKQEHGVVIVLLVLTNLLAGLCIAEEEAHDFSFVNGAKILYGVKSQDLILTNAMPLYTGDNKLIAVQVRVYKLVQSKQEILTDDLVTKLNTLLAKKKSFIDEGDLLMQDPLQFFIIQNKNINYLISDMGKYWSIDSLVKVADGMYQVDIHNEKNWVFHKGEIFMELRKRCALPKNELHGKGPRK